MKGNEEMDSKEVGKKDWVYLAGLGSAPGALCGFLPKHIFSSWFLVDGLDALGKASLSDIAIYWSGLWSLFVRKWYGLK